MRDWLQQLDTISYCTFKRLEMYLDAPPLSDPTVPSFSYKLPLHKLHATRAGDLF